MSVDGAGSTAQTLDRGLQLLDLIAGSPKPPSIGAVAAGLKVHRSVAYRLIRTLELRGLVVRDTDGGIRLGPHLATLARGVAPDLQTAAQPVLRALADELGMTAFLVVLDRGECVTLFTFEPQDQIASIALRPGSRHSALVGAPGIAVQTLLDPGERRAHGLPDEVAPEVLEARSAGYAQTTGEVLPGVSSIAAPLHGTMHAAIAVLFVSHDDRGRIADRVRAAAKTLGGHNR